MIQNKMVQRFPNQQIVLKDSKGEKKEGVQLMLTDAADSMLDDEFEKY